MKPNNIFSARTDRIAAADPGDSSLEKPGESFMEEKKSLPKKKSGKNIAELPAPFYDELHFANYE